ncbi:MAG: hypothetical protein ACI85K_000269, partial [Hyphomicrobiaceae bacterium]
MLRQILRPTGLCLFTLTTALVAQQEAAAPAAKPATPPAAMATIGSKELLEHATFLSSDALEGRLTGSPGQEAAAEYIKSHFIKLGLEPLGDVLEGDDDDIDDNQARSFVQHYGIKRTFVKDSELQLGETNLKYGFAVLGGREMKVDTKATLKFVGVGRTRGSRSDLEEDESLAGKIAVVVIKPPRGEVPKSLSIEQKMGMSFAVFGRLRGTARNLGKRGAEAVLFVQTEDKVGLSDVLNYL